VVFQSRILLVNQIDGRTATRAGHGRLFVGLDDDQVEGFRSYLKIHEIETARIFWGEPTIVIHDLDGNELFFWLSESERDMLREDVDGAARKSS